MTVTIDPTKRYVDIWLQHGEDFDIRDLPEDLNGYRVTIFRSGSGNLVDLTRELLRNNCTSD